MPVHFHRVLWPRKRQSVRVGSVSAKGGPGRACAFLRAAASARVAGGGGAKGLVLAAVLKMSWRLKRLPTPGAATMSTSSSTFTTSSVGAACVFRNHGPSGGMQLPFSTGVGEAGVGIGIE